MHIIKVSHSRKSISVTFTVEDEKRVIVSHDNPLPSFAKAFHPLPKVACGLLELPDSYADGMKITGIQIQTKGGNEHVILTGTKDLPDSSQLFRFSTPPRLLEQPVEEGKYSPPISDKQADLIADALHEVAKYARGERAQGQLDLEDDDDKSEATKAAADSEGQEVMAGV